MELNTFKKYNEEVWKYDRPLIESYKPILVHKKSRFLLDLGLKIMAYDFATKQYARGEYLGAKSFLEYGQTEEISQKEKDDVASTFESSILDERMNEQLKTMLAGVKSFRALASAPDDQGDDKKPEEGSLEKEFEKNILPQYNSFRRKSAEKLQKEFKLPNKAIEQLQKLAFAEIVALSNRKTSKERNPLVAQVVRFLEECVDYYFPRFLDDVSELHNPHKLLSLRKSAKHKFNTVCYRCGYPLSKRNNTHYCTKKVNRSCYDAHLKERRKDVLPRVILRTKNRCENCRRRSSLDHIHKYRGMWRQFCSNRCYGTFRQRKERERK